MRVVIDTNVLVSAFMNRQGTPGRVLDLLLARSLVVLHDNRILDEYAEVLSRPQFRFDPADILSLLDFIGHAGEYVAAQESSLEIPDRTDLPFLEVASSGFADALVTGNQRHFKPIRGRHGVPILSPAELIRRLA